MAATRRVLLVGWSAADWRLLKPLLDAGALPNLGRIIQAGATGNLQTLQPQFAPLLWASLDTGRYADAHGVVHALTPLDDGAPRPLTRIDRRCRALWNIVETGGQSATLINWPVTFPAEALQGACVSDLFFRLAGTAEGLHAPPPGCVHPPAMQQDLDELRFSPAELTREEMGFFLPDLDRAEAEQDPMLSQLAVAVAETISTQAAALHVLQETDWALAMVRFDILEALGPRFMACYPPQLPYVPDAAFERYRGTIPAVCRYLDLMLGVLVEQAGPETLVVLVSERGMHSDQLRPQTADLAFHAAGGSPWFREQGLVALHGPGVPGGGSVQGASLLDIAPTLLRYLGMAVSREMPGRVLVEAFTGLPEERFVESHESVAPAGHGGSAPGLSAEQAQCALERWQEVGLLTEADAHGPEAGARARRTRDFNLAMVAIEKRQPQKALDQLEFLHRQHPEDDRIALHLARCRRNTGDLEGARQLLERVVDHPDSRPYEQMQLAELHLAEKDYDKALLCLFRAEQAEGQRPTVHARIGHVYLRMERWGEAERAFLKALERDADHAESLRGLAATRLGQERHPEALEAALRATELDRNHPQGHYLLGSALLADGQAEVAARAFETCLALHPGHVRALRGLAQACAALGDETAAEAHRMRAQQLEAAALMERELRALRQRSR